MNFLLKPHEFCRYMEPRECTLDDIVAAVDSPQVIADKSRAPLAIFGTLVESPEIDRDSGLPRCIGDNVSEISVFQLDFDSGMSIDEFRERYARLEWHLYTSHSYGYKGTCDRYRVLLPLGASLPVEVLQSRRVRDNIFSATFGFPGADPSCAARGHFQICPCKRTADSPYVALHNAGERWLTGQDVNMYRQWHVAEKAALEASLEAARNRPRIASDEDLLYELGCELEEVPVNQGVRHDSAKRILARYAHKGIAHLLPSVPCPWEEPGWDREWQNLTQWASTLK